MNPETPHAEDTLPSPPIWLSVYELPPGFAPAPTDKWEESDAPPAIAELILNAFDFEKVQAPFHVVVPGFDFYDYAVIILPAHVQQIIARYQKALAGLSFEQYEALFYKPIGDLAKDLDSLSLQVQCITRREFYAAFYEHTAVAQTVLAFLIAHQGPDRVFVYTGL